ncbi:23S rRNA (guanosine(2251)-2'-O)-methyltransferase RlmB [Tannockella kyphosi]|uniref:23S rRNA (guanosine(2251)-2'-O)-methyltransferase RlmB n=1 Tax=Tannockella kyphosi TaxID=2899121 RepID=UPI002011874D|nr:23S rRNA (guanosine(2251)-2'-O)-methyltransferase RlmB [Tannockella kyphosi]
MEQYIYGRNTVMEALKGDKGIHKVCLLQKDSGIIELARKKNIPVEMVDKQFCFQAVGKVVHQGILACIEEYKYFEVEEILKDIPAGKQPTLLILDGLQDPHNLGAILRSADAIGVDGVIIGKHRSVKLNGTVAKVSTGAIDHVKVASVTNLTKTLESLKEKGYWVVGCDLSDKAQDYRQVDYNMPVALVMGSEGEGISRLVSKTCDLHVIIPMTGHVTSLNVSVATAVLLYQVHQSRHPL